MGFWTPSTDENRAIRKAEAENLSSDGALLGSIAMETGLTGMNRLKVFFVAGNGENSSSLGQGERVLAKAGRD